MNHSAMYHEQEAMERENMLNRIRTLESMLHDMESDFAECARTRKSPCFFCANHNSCGWQNCNFKWKSHN